MHQQVEQWVQQCVAQLAEVGDVVEFGSRDLNGTVRPLFLTATSYTGIDIEPGPGVDIVADARHVTITADTVVCCEVLEHVEYAHELVTAAAGVLRPGGAFIVTCAGPGRGRHSGRSTGKPEPDEWYRNIGTDELHRWMNSAGFAHIDVNTAGNDTRGFGRTKRE